MTETARARTGRRALFAAGAVALVAALALLAGAGRGSTWRLTASAGDPLGRRHALAEVLTREAAKRGLAIDLVPTAGSNDALGRVEKAELDLALVQGGLEAGPHVRQVAALVPEPLHLLVRPELVEGGLEALRGRRLNLGAEGSGTRRLALEVLAFAGLLPGRDFVDEAHGYAELETMDAPALPDGAFVVSQMPGDVAQALIRRDYRLAPLAFGEAMGLRDPAIEPATIPRGAYGLLPPVPDAPCETVATRSLLVAHERVPDAAVVRLLETLFGPDVAREARVTRFGPEALQRVGAQPLHPGALQFARRAEPLITHESIDNLESLRSFFVSCALAAFLLWRWHLRRRSLGFETYMDEVTRLEKRALELELSSRLDLRELLPVRQRLSELKSEALDRFAGGELRGEELMASFLTHVTDVRHYLDGLILHERDRIEDEAGQDVGQIDDLWRRAVGRRSGRFERPADPGTVEPPRV
jgi:TRAP transporter TAXI family solute receptor